MKMNKKRFAVVILCFVVSVFCLTISSCGDRFGTSIRAQCYVIVPITHTKMICSTTRTVDSDELNQESVSVSRSKYCTAASYDWAQTYPEEGYSMFYFNVEEKGFSSTETYVLDLQYQFYDENDTVTECSQNIVIPLGSESLEKTLPSEMAEGIIHIEYNYSRSI